MHLAVSGQHQLFFQQKGYNPGVGCCSFLREDAICQIFKQNQTCFQQPVSTANTADPQQWASINSDSSNSFNIFPFGCSQLKIFWSEEGLILMLDIQIISLPLSWNIALPIRCQPFCLCCQTSFIALAIKIQMYWEYNSYDIHKTNRDLEITIRVSDKSVTD